MFRVQSQSSYVIVTNVSVLLDERHWCFSYLGWFYFDREFSIKTSVINIIDFISNKLFVRCIVLFVSNLSSTLLSTFIILVLAIYSFPLYLVISCSGRCKVCVSTFLWKPTNDNCTVLEKRLPTASLLILCRKWPAVKWIRTIVSLSFRESFRRSGKNSCVWPCRKCRSDANGLLSEVTTMANANHVIDNHPGSNSVCVCGATVFATPMENDKMCANQEQEATSSCQRKASSPKRSRKVEDWSQWQVTCLSARMKTQNLFWAL